MRSHTLNLGFRSQQFHSSLLAFSKGFADNQLITPLFVRILDNSFSAFAEPECIGYKKWVKVNVSESR